MKNLLIVILSLLLHFSIYALTPNPIDKPIDFIVNETDATIKPYVLLSRENYIEAKKKYLRGLEKNQIFYVVSRITDRKGNIEQVFIEVSNIENDMITGRISNDTNVVTEYKLGDPVMVRESNIVDWLISNPDGSEDGNYVGKFLDALQDRYLPIVVSITVEKDGTVLSAKYKATYTSQKQDVSYCVPISIKEKSELLAKESKYKTSDKVVKAYTYFIYDIKTKKIHIPKK